MSGLTRFITQPLKQALDSKPVRQNTVRRQILNFPGLTGYGTLASAWQPNGDFEVEVDVVPYLNGSSATYYCVIGNSAPYVDGTERSPTLLLRGDGALHLQFGNGTASYVGASGPGKAVSGKIQKLKLIGSANTLSASVNGSIAYTIAVSGVPNAIDLVGRRGTSQYYYAGKILSLRLTDYAGGDNRYYPNIRFAGGNMYSLPSDGDYSKRIIWSGDVSEQVFTKIPGNKWLGPEVVTNGGFDSATGWNLGAGWSISGGAAVSVGGNTGVSVYRSIGQVPGARYRVRTVVSQYASGRLDIYSGGLAQQVSSAGTNETTWTPGNTNPLYLTSATPFVGAIDSISYRELLEWAS